MTTVYRALRRRGAGQVGFTLVELLAVVAILAVLTGAAIPMIGNQRRSSAFQQTRANLETAVGVLNSYMISTYGNMPNLSIHCLKGTGSDYSSCMFPADLGGDTAGEKISKPTPAAAVDSVVFKPKSTFEKSADVELLYVPCSVNHSASSVAPCTDSDPAGATARNFDVYAYDAKMSSDIRYLLYKSQTGKYYAAYTAPRSGCITDTGAADPGIGISGSGEYLCEI